MSGRQPVGEAATVWALASVALANQNFAEAGRLGAEAATRCRAAGLRMGEAAGALVSALAQVAPTPPGAQLVVAIVEIGASWSETAALLTAPPGAISSGPWGKAAAAAAKAASSSEPLRAALALCREVGVLWGGSPIAGITVEDLCLTKAQQTDVNLVAASKVPEISDPRKRAEAQLVAAEAQLSREAPAAAVATRAAKEALAAFRELGDREAEGRALLQVCKAQIAAGSAIEGLQAANQALRTFKDLGNKKGEAAASMAVAQANLAKHSAEDSIWKATEALKLYRQLGDRMGEVLAQTFCVNVQIMMRDARKAVSAASDVVAIARSLGDALGEAKALLLLARAQAGIGEKGGADALANANEAMSRFQMLKLGTKLECEALEAIMSAHQAKQEPDLAMREAQRFADRLRQQGQKQDEASTMKIIASVHLAYKEPDQALRAAQTALAGYRGLGDRKGEAATLLLLSEIRIQKDEPGESLRVAESALTVYRRLGNDTAEDEEGAGKALFRDGEIKALRLVGKSNAMMGGADEALRVAYDAAGRFKSLQDKRGEASMMVMMGEMYSSKQMQEDALNVLVQAPAMFLSVGDRRGEAEAWQKMAEIHTNKGEAAMALRSAEEALGCFKKCGDKLGKAVMSQMVADSHFLLASVGAANGQDALRAAQEAIATFQELGDKKGVAKGVHSLANAQLMTRSFQDALRTSRESQGLYRELGDTRGEASSCLLEAGAFLGEGEYDSARRAAKEAQQLFRQAGDLGGDGAADDFHETVGQYEKGQLNKDEFIGFSMQMTQTTVGPGGAPPVRRERPVRRKQMSNLSDIELIKADASKDSKTILCVFEGFETRQAGKAPSRPNKGGAAAGGGAFSGGFEDDMNKRGGPQREQVLYSVRWVQCAQPRANSPPRGSSPPGSKRSGRREFTKEEDKQVKLQMDLRAPREGWGSRAGPTTRMFEAVGGDQKGV